MTKTSLQKSPNAEEKNRPSEPAFLYKLLKIYTH